MKGKGESFWQEVRRAYENGEGSYQTLADRFGVSRGAMASHGRIEGWNRKKQESTDLQEMTGKLSRAAMREIGRLEEGEADVKTIRELTALLKELLGSQAVRIGHAGAFDPVLYAIRRVFDRQCKCR